MNSFDLFQFTAVIIFFCDKPEKHMRLPSNTLILSDKLILQF